MNDILLSRSPATSFRAWLVRTWAEPESRSTLVGVAGVVIFYLLVWLAGPRLLRFEAVSVVPRTDAAAKEFNIEIAPDLFAEEEKPVDPFKFVETNPDAPENVPDQTRNFGAQNQQVAQETPTPDGTSDRPATEGRENVDTTQIVSGQLTQPLEHVEAVPEVRQSQEAVASPPLEQNPLSGYEKAAGENEETYGSNVAKIPENMQPVPERVEGEKVAPLIEGLTPAQPAIDPRKPQPRPQLVSKNQVRPAILADNEFGTKNVGPTSYDARWSNYGAYLQRLIDTVQIQWERILVDTKVYPPPSTVAVKFVLNAEGKIARIVSVEGSSTEAAKRACVSAITDRAPYGVWTDDMQAMLGQEQEMTFTFHYQ